MHAYQIDMKVERTFTVSNYKIVPYFLVKNLLDAKNTIFGYDPTGDPETCGYLESPEGVVRSADAVSGEDFAYRYDFQGKNPKNYGSPRMIFFGLRMSF